MKHQFSAESETKDGRQLWISPDAATLMVLAGADRGKQVPIPGQVGGTITVGKSADNDLVLADETVSRKHMSVTRTEKGILLKDLGSTNGVRIGSAKVEEALVEPGAIVFVGDAEVMVRVEPKGAVLTPSAADRFQIARGGSIQMRRIFALLERMAPTDATVLLMGETGTGKDVLARSIHMASARHKGPFEVVDCGAIAATLIESELFGHEKGAFTGADRANEGAFERARGGTIFLDEIGELPLALQPKLLRVLEAREVKRLGGTKSLPVDVRIIAATMRDVQDEVTAGRFRQDLYFRLAVVPITVPPLRSRPEDIPALVEDFVARAGLDLKVSPEVMAALRSYEWPGNTRELRNVLERALYLAQASGDTELRYVDFGTTPADTGEDVFHFPDGVSYRDARMKIERAFEARFVQWLLNKTGGNVRAAARAAQMDRNYLSELIRKHGVDKPRS
jgi:transcriptional regulator with GAF, ATPase, and Fis domain